VHLAEHNVFDLVLSQRERQQVQILNTERSHGHCEHCN
jgi:hypothetical protein